MKILISFPIGMRPPPTAIGPPANIDSNVSHDLSHSSGSSDVDGMMNVKMSIAERSNDDLFVTFVNDFPSNERDDELYIFQ